MARKLLALVAGLLLFVIALELLKKGAAAYGRQIIGMLHVRAPLDALGLGWIMAYFFLSGSPVAAVAVSLFAAGTIDALSTFTMITGSRLGAALIVLISGFVYNLRGRSSNGLAVGVLALTTTAAIYLPALAVGYWLISNGQIGTLRIAVGAPISSPLDILIDPLVAFVTALLPGWVVLPCGLIVLVGAFNLLDHALPEIGGGHQLLHRLEQMATRPANLFLLGAGITALTLSVSVSVGILVPLTVRGLVRREHSVPYIMGANITTFIDTLVAALIVGGPAAFSIVLVEVVAVALISLLVIILAYAPFERAMLRIEELISLDRRVLAIFIAVFFVLPLGLIIL